MTFDIPQALEHPWVMTPPFDPSSFTPERLLNALWRMTWKIDPQFWEPGMHASAFVWYDACDLPHLRDFATDVFRVPLGSDGRYHLVTRSGMTCFATFDRDDPSHSMFCNVPRRHESPGQSTQYIARWSVDLLDETASIFDVARYLQCPCAHPWWPPVGATRPARVLAQLRAEFGPFCQACDTNVATVLDHDYFSGLIRGALCRECNRRVDDCIHPSGCAYSEYLSAPPALPLGLQYPGWRQAQLNPRPSHRLEVLTAIIEVAPYAARIRPLLERFAWNTGRADPAEPLLAIDQEL